MGRVAQRFEVVGPRLAAQKAGSLDGKKSFKLFFFAGTFS